MRRLDDLTLEVEDWLPELASEAVARRIGERGLDFTAILTAGDSLAFGAIHGIEQAGFGVPADVSVVGMDDLPLSAFCNPPLTTMHLPMHEIGSAALSLLLDDLAPTTLPPRRIEFACHLVVRETTAPVRAQARRAARCVARTRREVRRPD